MNSKYTEEDIEEAERIVNDIAERCDNREPVQVVRRALEIYADKLQELRLKHNKLVNQLLMLAMEEINEN